MMNKSRYFIIAVSFFGWLACNRVSNTNEEAKATKKPNILIAISDDMSWIDMSFMGNEAVSTPNIDALAKEGMVFENAYCSTPSCTASRAAFLTGRNGFELEQGAVLWGFLPDKFKTYTDYLEEAGYKVGFTGKGWAPGKLHATNRKHNPAGEEFNDSKFLPFVELGNEGSICDIDYIANFKTFLKGKQEDQPFCFWYGSKEPHRGYVRGIGEKAGMQTSKVKLPDFYPQDEGMRSDVLDYLFEIQWFDTQIGKIVNHLKEIGEYDNTLIIVTADNGMPFPRAKSNLYEAGTHMPFIAVWKNKIIPGKSISDLISQIDVAPTVMQAAGLEIPKEMTGKTLMPYFEKATNQVAAKSRSIITYRERHAWSYADGKTYPSRAIRKGDMLLIWNMEPQRLPAGIEDGSVSFNNYAFGDVDNGLSKDILMSYKNRQGQSHFFDLSFGLRSEYELYNVKEDPFQLKNLAAEAAYQKQFENLNTELVDYLKSHNDMRVLGKEEVYINTPYYSTKGIESGGIDPSAFEKLSAEEQQKLQDAERQKLKKNTHKIDSLFGMGASYWGI
ncbi:sulfatase [Persicobacter psychrovividus]|uniref:Heparan N-sulfatase n=1 Tax=Persicobacter psychrovividus TaxID=387638 RepID=A0ABM7VLX5_9BACT|nr:heparan N-sulfatase [Persicobacter psychrovividus]